MLHPAGCFAAWTYGLPTLVHKDHPANATLLHLYDAVLGAYWADGRRHVETAYAEIAPAAGREFRAVERLSFDAPKTACVDDVVRRSDSFWKPGSQPCLSCHLDASGGAPIATLTPVDRWTAIISHTAAAALLAFQVGLVRSWSAYHTFLEQHPQQEDPVLGFKQDLLRSLGAQVGSGPCGGGKTRRHGTMPHASRQHLHLTGGGMWHCQAGTKLHAPAAEACQGITVVHGGRYLFSWLLSCHCSQHLSTVSFITSCPATF